MASRTEKYVELYTDEDGYASNNAKRERNLRRSLQFVPFRLSRVAFYLSGFFLSLVAIFVLASHSAAPLIRSYFPNQSDDSKASSFHLLIPANNISPNVCKVLLSTIILGYPAPILINFNQSFEGNQHESVKDALKSTIGAGGTHLAKTGGVARYLHSLPSNADDDLVVVVDGLDCWFQLRPSVLLERYHDIISRQNGRLREKLGSYAIASHDIVQRVIFSSQKTCSPLKVDKAGCNVIPQSTLPEGIFGPDTDVHNPWVTVEQNPDVNNRDRFLNSGSATGKPKDVLAVFERAQNYSMDPKHDYGGSDQGIFADIFGEQEIWRSAAAARSKGAKESDVPFYSELNSTEPRFNYELGIGLDYENLLVLATNNHDGETAYIRYNDVEEIASLSKSMRMSQPRVGPLPNEVVHSAPPFASLGSISGSEEVKLGWADIPLFTNVRTGFTPVVVHHNEWRNNAKERLNTTWNETWFQPYAKALFEALRKGTGEQRSSGGGTGAVEETVRMASGQRYQWAAGRGIIKTDYGAEFGFEELCGSAFDVIFEDQKG